MLYLLMAACTGGPDKNDSGNTVVDTENLVITEFGATIEGEPSYYVSLSNAIGEEPEACQTNVEVTDCNGVRLGYYEFADTVTLDYEVSEGLCLEVSAGDTREQYLTSYDSPTHGNEVVFRSNWTTIGPVTEDIEHVNALDWYLTPTSPEGEHISYYCYRDLYWYVEGAWELDELGDQINGGPFTYETMADGRIESDGPFGGMFVNGYTIEARTDERVTITDTWQSSDGTSFGATDVLAEWSKEVISCYDRTTL